MVRINFTETSKVTPRSMIKRTSGSVRFPSTESAPNVILPCAPAWHIPRAPWIIPGKAAAPPCRGKETALHQEPCTPQGAFPELSAQSTAKHCHSVNRGVLTWESVREGLRCCLCFRTTTKKNKESGICFIPAANSWVVQIAAPTCRAEPWSLGVYDPGKRQGRAAGKTGHRRQCRQSWSALLALLTAPAWAHTAMRERKREGFDAVRWEGSREEKADLEHFREILLSPASPHSTTISPFLSFHLILPLISLHFSSQLKEQTHKGARCAECMGLKRQSA